jgi:hypothetical protein
MILGKSNHPVNIKKIHVRLWKLRDEIETAISNIAHEAGSSAYQAEFEKLVAFYKIANKHNEANQSEAPAIANEESSDDEMAAMMNALESAEEANPEETTPEEVSLDEVHPTEQNEQAQKQHALLNAPKRATPNENLISNGTLLLNDINMDYALIFSKHEYTIGQSIVIEFLIPQKFTLSAEVVYNQKLASQSRIISETRPNNRVQAKLLFSYPHERTNLRNFLKSVEPELPKSNKKEVTKTEEDTSDNIDDELAELGL